MEGKIKKAVADAVTAQVKKDHADLGTPLTVTEAMVTVTVDAVAAKTYTATVTVPAATEVGGETLAADLTANVDVTVTIKAASEWKCGDVNHDSKVNNKDAVYIMDYGAGLLPEDETNEIKNNRTFEADTLKDGKINNKDAVAIMDFGAGFYPSLPVE